MLNSNSRTLGVRATRTWWGAVRPGARLRAMAIALGVALAAATLSYAQGPLEDLSAFPRTGLDILHGKSKKEPRHFDVWIANTPARQEQGLMFVQTLQADQGMLFPLAKPKKMSMWMKNTYVELDILFIGEKGAIEQIIQHAQPRSLQMLNSDKPVISVLELRGGEAAALDLKVGDRVNWEQPDGCDCGLAPPPAPKKTS